MQECHEMGIVAVVGADAAAVVVVVVVVAVVRIEFIAQHGHDVLRACRVINNVETRAPLVLAVPPC
jgi:hypothetical protein